MSRKTDDSRLYGIGAVARLTGLTDHTIRVWERRYAAVVAARAPNGRRQYTEADVQKLGLLKVLTDHGISISRVAADSIDELRERVDSLRDLAAGGEAAAVRVAVLGDFLPRQLLEHKGGTAPLDLCIADSSRERFAADLRQQTVDAVVLERPVLDGETLAEMQQHLADSGSAQGVIVYSFGRTRDIEAVAKAGIVALRAPVGSEELCDAVARAAQPGTRVARDAQPPDESPAAWDFAGPVAARRFSPQQLANLASASSDIECECPKHLAQLVSDLSAFEIYSDRCANRDDEDAALHRYLHRTTAAARALVETALDKVAEAEGLRY
ncbi:MAG: MerR family transcriptional regulator [Gammaproteobacteria bacterium]|nr:MerR family transcriptional regulator [Gammaproteobacteria bacterium]